MRRRTILSAAAWPWLGALASPTSARAANVEPHFATPEEAAEALIGGPDRAYIDGLNLREMRARWPSMPQTQDPDAGRAALRAFYAARTRSFTDTERSALADIVAWCSERVAPRSTLFARTPWSFVKVDGSVEGGMPHTRGDSIVLPAPFLARMVEASARWANGSRATTRPGADVLLHEQTHVLQRQQPARFESLHVDVYGFRRMSPPPRSTWHDTHVVANPDAPELCWAWQRPEAAGGSWIVPSVVLPDGAAPTLDAMQPVALEVTQREGRWSFVDDATLARAPALGAVRDYGARFDWTDENFHPNELTADLVALWLLEGTPRNGASTLFGAACDWARTHLA